MSPYTLFALFSFMFVAGCIHDAARAHDWYDRDCCDAKDCRPSPVGEITLVPGGYEYRQEGTGPVHFFKIGDPKIRNSQDNRFHACPILYQQIPRCIYVPGGST